MGYDRASYQRHKADALFHMGFRAEMDGRAEEAVARYERAIQADPGHQRSYAHLGRLHRRLGRTEMARHYLDAAEQCLAGHIPGGPPQVERPTCLPSPRQVVGAESEDAPEASDDDKLKGMLPHAWEAFFGRFESLRDVQRSSIPIVLGGRDAMVMAPTASGKTEAIFAPLVERMLSEGWPGLSVLYIAPTRALVEDMAMRLSSMVGGLGVRIAQRNGDSKTLDGRDPQNMLVTTPESLDSLMSMGPDLLRGIRAVVLDELHMLDGNYRGDQLRILLRRLSEVTGHEPSIYATSATVSDPASTAGRYMIDAEIVRSGRGRAIEHHIVPDLEHAAMRFRGMGARKALVFCNTPYEAEGLARSELRRHFPRSTIKVHHGRLDASMRQDAEGALRDGRDVVCACTSALEAGVDIGDIDVVILFSRPRSVASLSQRIGRANRREGRIRVIALASTPGEATYYRKVLDAIVRSEYDTDRYSFDSSVAVQQIMSSLAGGETRSNAFIHAMLDGLMPRKDVDDILSHLSEGGWIAGTEDGWMATDRIRRLGPGAFSNIPRHESIEVIDLSTGSSIGRVGLPVDNVFVLAGRAWLVRERGQDTVSVTPVSEGTEIANFSSHDSSGAFFDMLPHHMRLRAQRRN